MSKLTRVAHKKILEFSSISIKNQTKKSTISLWAILDLHWQRPLFYSNKSIFNADLKPEYNFDIYVK